MINCIAVRGKRPAIKMYIFVLKNNRSIFGATLSHVASSIFQKLDLLENRRIGWNSMVSIPHCMIAEKYRDRWLIGEK